jgi:hypothetical protein
MKIDPQNVCYFPMKPSSDSRNNRPPDSDNKTGHVIIHQVDDMMR